ncbi:MAG: Threonine 3-dehydrogenase [Pseudomonadota bacterium]
MTDTMLALTYDRVRDGWTRSTGLVKERVPVPRVTAPDHVLLRVKYAGFCGSDRGIWWRKAFGDMIEGSLAEEDRTTRVVGHEMLAEIVEVGPEAASRWGYRPGDVVSTESHIICEACYQCRAGDTHVCARDRIIGISTDGCFAEYLVLPARSLWRTDLARIRPEVAAVQEPFGNAVHACQATDLRGKSVAVVGCGTIGLFAVLIARGMGARQVIGVEVDPHHAALARRLGCDAVLTPQPAPPDRPHASDPSLRAAVRELTDGVGVDVALEMAGFNSSLNNALRITRRGGHTVLFGVKNGDAVIEDVHRVVMDGLQLHGIVGRRIFETWEITRALLEDRANGIQDAVWEHILNRGDGTLVDIRDWERGSFEATIRTHPKALIRFAG